MMLRTCSTCKYLDLLPREDPCYNCKKNDYAFNWEPEEEIPPHEDPPIKVVSNGYAKKQYYIKAKCLHCLGEFEIREDLWIYTVVMTPSRLKARCPQCANCLQLPVPNNIPPIVLERIQANTKHPL